MQTLTYVVGTDKRALVSDVQNFQINWSTETSYNWVQARQYENSMRQVFVNVKNANNTPFDLTGCNIWFEGLLPDDTHRILDAKHATVIDAQSGQFRFDFPAQAFAVAGSYKQAFFRIVRDGMSVTTLEFDLEVLADKVISGVVATDYITPFEDLYSQLEEILTNADGDLQAKLTEWTQEYNAKVQELTALGTSVTNSLTSIQTRLAALETKIEEDGLFTRGEADEFKTNFSSTINEALNNTIDEVNATLSEFSDLNSTNSLIADTEFEDIEEKVTDFVENLDDSKFKILLAQDQHYSNVFDILNQDPYGEGFRRVLKMTNKLSLVNGHVDVAVFNGDNIDGGSTQNGLYNGEWDAIELTPAEQVGLNLTRTITNTNRDMLFKADVFLNIGNHDFGAWDQVSDGYLLNYKQVLQAYNFNGNSFGETRQGFNAYKDYPSAKVRVMTVDLYNYPEIYTTGGWRKGNVKYTKIGHSVVTQSTLEFVKNALSSTPTGYTVLIFAHQPFKGYAYGKTEGNYDDGLPTRINHELLNGLLQAYNGKRSYSGSGDNDDYPATISADFSNAAGTIGGCFFGHEHRDVNPENVGGVYGTVRQAFVPYDRGEYGTINQYSFDVLEVDSTNKHIKIKRFGNGSDISYDY